MPRRPSRQWLLVGVVAGLFAAVVVRSAVAALLGSLTLLALLGGVALVWLFLRGPRDGSS